MMEHQKLMLTLFHLENKSALVSVTRLKNKMLPNFENIAI